tara:strand:+ start:518 stop:1033 length:516 start_codon:yes stop_codon:yes gene_type:complete
MIYHSSIDNLKVSIICNKVSDWNSMSFDKIFANNRKREAVESRYLIFYFMKRHTNLSFDAVGRVGKACGINKEYNHATVMHACKWVRDRVSVEKMFRFQIEKYNTQIENSLHQNVELDDMQKYPEYLNELIQCLNERKEHKEIILIAMYLRKLRDESSTVNTQKNPRMEMV